MIEGGINLNKRILTIGILFLFVCSAFIPMSLGINTRITDTREQPSIIGRGKTLYVGGSGEDNYTKIQDAIDNASDGDTVFVYNGIYEEYIHIDVSINLLGEDKLITILNNSQILIQIPHVSISGFTMQYGKGIRIYNYSFRPSHNNIITDNIFKSNNPIIGGVEIENSSNNIVSNNSFFNNGLQLSDVNLLHNFVYNNTVNSKPLVYFEDTSDKVIDKAGQVIFVRCNNMTIENQEICNTNQAIQLFNTDNSYIIYNTISNNIFGIKLDNSNNNIILKNTFTNTNPLGIGLYDGSSNITIVDNSFLSGGIFISSVNLNGWNTHTIQNNSINGGKIYYYKNNHIGAAIPSDASMIILANCSNFIIENRNLSDVHFGIQLGYSSYNTISQNTINNNLIAIRLTSSSNNNIFLNTLNDNWDGVILYSSKENNIYRNSFKNNTYAIYSSIDESTNDTDFTLSKKYIPGWKLFERYMDNNITSVESSNNIISNNTFFDNSNGIGIVGMQSNIISNNTFLNNYEGISLIMQSNNNIISGNNIIGSDTGIIIVYSSSCKITNNNISSNLNEGILILYYSENNYISGNIISNNHKGIQIYSDFNIINHNNFINNGENAYEYGDNIWDDGKYGNYWSDYEDKYPDAKPRLLKPWVWDTPYEIPGGDNKDMCPLIEQWPNSLSRTMPRNEIPINTLFLRFLEQFPILHRLLSLIRV